MTMSVSATVTQNPGCFTSFTNHCLAGLHFLADKISTAVAIIFGSCLGCMQGICASALVIGGLVIGGFFVHKVGNALDVHCLNSPDL